MWKSVKKLMHTASSNLFFLLQGGGFGYDPQSKYKYLIFAYAMYLFIMFVMNYYFLTAAWIYTDDFDVKAEVLEYLLECFHICAKFIIYNFRYKKVRELLKFVDEMRESSRSDPDNHSLIVNSEQSETTFAKLAAIGSECVAVIFFTCTLLNYLITGRKKLPLVYWVPFDSHQYFWLATIFQLFVFLTPVQVFNCCMGFNIVLAKIVTSEMKILQRLLTTRDAKANTRLTAYRIHQNIDKLMSQMNELLSAQFLFEISLSALILSIRIYAFILAVLAGKEGLLFAIGILFISLSSPCAISWVGELIKSESEKIYEAAYDNVWYEEEDKTKKELMLVLKASLRPHSLHYRHLISFDMEQFGTLVQATYSYLTLLLRFGDLS